MVSLYEGKSINVNLIAIDQWLRLSCLTEFQMFFSIQNPTRKEVYNS
jgi:hypothetical protein